MYTCVCVFLCVHACMCVCIHVCGLVCACSNTGMCSCFVCVHVLIECLCASVPHDCAVCI